MLSVDRAGEKTPMSKYLGWIPAVALLLLLATPLSAEAG
jgi:hypothetical protein